MARLNGQARVAQVGLARRKAEKVRSKGMGVSIDGVQLWALLDTIDELKGQLESVDVSVMAERHEVELARVCADHKDELSVFAEGHAAALAARESEHAADLATMHGDLTLVKAERDEARRALTAIPVAQPVVEADVNGKKPRATRTKEEPWKSICVAADMILRDELELWGQPLPEALTAWAEGNGQAAGADVDAWLKALATVIPVSAEV